MYDHLINLPYSKFEKELQKIYKNNLQPKDKIEWERKILASESRVIGVTSTTFTELKKVVPKRKTGWEEIKKMWDKKTYEDRILAQKILTKAKRNR